MTELELLIGSYWDGTISPSEKERLFDLIADHTTDGDGENYTQYLNHISTGSAAANIKDVHFQMQLDEIKTRLGMSKSNAPLPMTRLRVWGWKWYAAASILLLAGTCYWLLNKPAKEASIARSNGQTSTVSYINDRDRVIDSLLPDGSGVRLYPGSALSYTKAFNEGQRDVRMRGKILFIIHKDSAKPFTVYAGDFSTTVLGTQFEVNTGNADKFTVKLISGKVVVKPAARAIAMTAIYLRPGERLTYDLRLRRSRVDEGMDSVKKNDRVREAKIVRQNPGSELTFSNLPLNILFRQLEQEYGIMIWCDENLARDKIYSGTFLRGDSPGKVLEQIARKFHLHVHKEDNAFIVE